MTEPGEYEAAMDRIGELEQVIERLEAMYREAREKGYDLSCPIRAWNDRTEKAISAAKRGEPAQ